MEQHNGGEWQIQPVPQKQPGKRKEILSVDIHQKVLKGLLGTRTIAVEKEIYNPITKQNEKKFITETKTNLEWAFDSCMEMVTHSDTRIKGVGVHLLIDFVNKTKDIVYHPSVLAKVDIDKLLTQEEKDIFMICVEKINQKIADNTDGNKD